MQELREQDIKGGRESGFTLIELLVAIVVVGVLTAVAIVGIAGLTDNGKASACQASLDAAKAASAVHYSNSNGNFPTDFEEMITAKELEVPSTVEVLPATPKLMTGNGWTLTIGGGGSSANTYSGTCA
jgi:prepilin-type N-terminal cleavage/methylation domain-containing protein